MKIFIINILINKIIQLIKNDDKSRMNLIGAMNMTSN